MSTKHAKDDLEQATQTLLDISTNPTVSVLKSILERKKHQQNNKKKDRDNLQTHKEDYGFVRGAKYFGRDSK
ncbi:hypothetical protein [Virgibacillus pantothenticus]|uniref:hypothetical protein n=1 Tax=Virgibacillus pantothenticus TaxID=1473 RepID=UPI0020B31B42|nr:hypothetical protein [Virgibacillus pantothenticus]MEB5457756.1 hypothetical protein [Virgibacillus pantothenticus]MEB5470374.1 hypothetical protein [Virgibacillus pantothenticus]